MSRKTDSEGKGKAADGSGTLPPLLKCCKCGAAVEGNYHGLWYCGSHLVQAIRGEP